MRTYFDIMADIRWSNGPLSDLNNSYCTTAVVWRHLHNIMRNITVFE